MPPRSLPATPQVTPPARRYALCVRSAQPSQLLHALLVLLTLLATACVRGTAVLSPRRAHTGHSHGVSVLLLCFSGLLGVVAQTPPPPPALTGRLTSLCFTTTAAPVACYEASNATSSTWPDLTGNGNTLTLSGTNQSAVSPVASGIGFNGTTSFALDTSYGPASLATNFTFMAWVWPTNVGVTNTLFTVSRSPTNVAGQASLLITAAAMLSYVDYGSATGISGTSSNFVVANAWNHIALVRTGTTATFYINAVPSGTATSSLGSAVTIGNTYLCLGKDGRDSVNFFNGYLGQVVFLNTAQTANSIQSIFSSTSVQYLYSPPPPSPPPIWVTQSCSFGETHRLTAPANAPNNTLLSAYPPTDTGSAGNWTFTPGSTVAWVNNAMYFDGSTNAYISFGPVAFGGTPFSISIWFRYLVFGTGYSPGNGFPRVFDFEPAFQSIVGFFLTVSPTGVPQVWIASNNMASSWSGASIVTGQWNHFVLAFTPGSTSYAYLNGVQQTLSGTPATTTQTWSYLAGLGKSSFTSDIPFMGSMADFRFFSRALAPSEVTVLYTSIACQPPPAPPPVAYGSLPSLAQGKPTIASSYYSGWTTIGAFPVRFSTFNSSVFSTMCNINPTYALTNSGIFHSSGSDSKPWWQVDLGALYTITDVQLWTRADNGLLYRLGPLNVYVTATSNLTDNTPSNALVYPNAMPCASFPANSASAQSFQGPCAGVGRYVLVQQTGPTYSDNLNLLTLCQIQVIGAALPPPPSPPPPPPPVWVTESCSFGETHRLTAPANFPNNALLTAYPPIDTGSAGNWTFTSGSTVTWINNTMYFDGSATAYVVFGGASSVGGNAQYHVSGQGAVISFGGTAWSIAAWVNIASFGANCPRIWSFVPSSGTEAAMLCSGISVGNNMQFNLNGAPSTLIPSATISANTWYHIVMTYAPGPSAIQYINGVPYTQTMSSNMSQQNYTYVAGLGLSPWSADPNFNGYISDWRFFNRALTQSEVTALYTGVGCQPPPPPPLPPPSPPPIWITESCSYGETHRLTIPANALNNTLLSTYPPSDTGSAASWTLTAGSTVKWINSAMSFDGSSNAYVSFGAISFGGSSFSLSVWFQVASVTAWTRIFDFESSSSSNAGILLATPNSSSAVLWIGGGQVGSTAISLSTWYHFVLSLNPGSTSYYYVNGVQFTVSGTPTVSLTTWSGVAGLGKSAFATDPYFNGAISDFRFFARALSQTDVTALYNGVACSPPPSPPSPPPSPPPALTGLLTSLCYSPAAVPVACYEASNATSTTWPDLTGNGNTLTFYSVGTRTAVSPSASGVLFSSSYALATTYSPNISSSFTLLMWIWPTSGTGLQQLWSVSRSGSSVMNEAELALNSTTLQFGDYNGTWGFQWGNIASNTTVTLNAWNLVGVVRTSGTSLTMWINGLAAGTFTTSNAVTYGTTNMILGVDYYLLGRNAPPLSYFSGYIGQIVLLNTAQPASSIQSMYSSTSALYFYSPPPPPVWITETCSFGEMHRLTAPANLPNNALLTAYPPIDTGSAGNWTFTSGSTVTWINNTMYFDGSATAYVVFGGASSVGGNAQYHVSGQGAVISFGGTAWSIAAWVNIASFGANCPRIWSFVPSSGTEAAMLCSGISVGNNMQFNLNGAPSTLIPSATISANTWYHIVMTYAPGPSAIQYINGVPYTQTMSSNMSQQNYTYVAGLGLSPWSADPNFNGYISDWRFFNRALTQSEVTALYTGVGCQPPSPPLPPSPPPQPPSPPPIAATLQLPGTACFGLTHRFFNGTGSGSGPGNPPVVDAVGGWTAVLGGTATLTTAGALNSGTGGWVEMQFPAPVTLGSLAGFAFAAWVYPFTLKYTSSGAVLLCMCMPFVL